MLTLCVRRGDEGLAFVVGRFGELEGHHLERLAVRHRLHRCEVLFLLRRGQSRVDSLEYRCFRLFALHC